MPEVTFQEVIDGLSKKVGEMAVNEVAAKITIEKLQTEINSLKEEIGRLNGLPKLNLDPKGETL